MGLGSCPKCWESICECGHMYRHWTPRQMLRLAKKLRKMAKEKAKEA